MQRDVYRRYGWNGWWINWKPKILGHQKWPWLYKQEGSWMVPHVCNTLLNVTGVETDINLCFITYICTHSHKHPSSGESLLYSLLNILNFFFNNFIYLFWSVLDLHCCTGFTLVVASRCYSLLAVCMLLIEMASLVMEHRLLGCTGFSSCDTPA